MKILIDLTEQERTALALYSLALYAEKKINKACPIQAAVYIIKLHTSSTDEDMADIWLHPKYFIRDEHGRIHKSETDD